MLDGVVCQTFREEADHACHDLYSLHHNLGVLLCCVRRKYPVHQCLLLLVEALLQLLQLIFVCGRIVLESVGDTLDYL